MYNKYIYTYILYTNHTIIWDNIPESKVVFLHCFCSPFWDTPMWHTQSTRLGLCQSSWGWTLDLIAFKKVIIHNGISWLHSVSVSYTRCLSVCPVGLKPFKPYQTCGPAGPGAGSISSLAFRRLTLNIAGFHSSPDTLLRDLGPAVSIMVGGAVGALGILNPKK